MILGTLLFASWWASLGFCSLLLGSLSILCFLMWKLASRIMANGWTGWKTLWPTRGWKLLKLGVAAVTISLSLFGVYHAGYSAGYGYRDHELTNNTHTYWDVIVLERYSDKRFKIQPAMADEGVWDTCFPQDWQSGQKMDWVTVEQRLGCKSIRYQHFYSDEKGERINASLQIR